MKNIFFDSWESVFRTIFITIMAYSILVVLLRSSGKRTLSKMNAFDLIVTVALGSTLATVILNKNVALIDGVLAFFLLIFLQYLITYLSVRYRVVSNIVKSTPTLLVYKGQMLKNMMLKERVDEGEIYAVIRQNGLSSLDQANAVILETDGTLTVVDSPVSMKDKTMNELESPL